MIAPLVIAELNADPACIGVYYGVSAAASLLAQMGCGSFIVRYGAMRMSQVALALIGGGIAVAATGSVPGFAASAIIAVAAGRSRPRPVRNCLAGSHHPAWRRWCFRSSRPRSPREC